MRKAKILCALLVAGVFLVAAPTDAYATGSMAHAGAETPDLVLSGDAWRLADQAYTAYATEDYAATTKFALEAIALAPDAPQLYLLMIYALQKQGDQSGARQVAFRAQAQGLRRSIFDTLANDPERTAPPTLPQSRRYAQAAYQAYAENRYTDAVVAARAAVAAHPADTELQQLLTTTLAAGTEDQNREALLRLDAALAAEPNNMQWLMQRGYLHQRLGQPAQAHADFSRARDTGEAPVRLTIDDGYAMAAAGDRRAGASALKEALDKADAGQLPLTADERLNLRQNIANMDREWGAYVSAGYRGARAATSGLGGSPIAALGDAGFSTAEIFWRPAGLLNSSSSVFELYGRLSNTLHDTGTDVAQSIDACGNQYAAESYRSVSGIPSTVGALGLRFMPSSDLGLTFGLERRANIGSRARIGSATPYECSQGIAGKEYEMDRTDGDWMAYLTYAYYKGTELRHDAPHWLRVEAYVQAGYLWSNNSVRFRDSGAQNFDQNGAIRRDYRYAISEIRVGRSVRFDSVSSSLLLYPHVVVAADWQNENTRAHIDGVGRYALRGNGASWSMGAGPGFGVRYWFGSDHYRAERSYMDWSIHYLMNIGGGAKDRSEGVFMNLTYSW
ncbi:MAG: hypothetical protein ITG07_00295 [Candidimonas sp.]|nr:hypothetical protein [Candidimonas sp.]